MFSSLYFARKASTGLLLKSDAAPPHLKRVFWTSILRSLPWYMFGVIISVEMTTAVEFGFEFNRSRARSIEIIPAEHPIPERLKLLTSGFNLYLLSTIPAIDGVGANRLQLTIKKSIDCGSILQAKKKKDEERER